MRVLLLDADGVLITPERPFSQIYAKQAGIDPARLTEFFHGDFREALVGRADLLELIRRRHDLWQWDGPPRDLLRQWFESENRPDLRLLDIVGRLRAGGTPVYIATDQEPYRLQYLREVMFAGKIDGIFASCELGVRKIDPHYFELVIEQLRSKYPSLSASDIAFYDDGPANVASARRAGIPAKVYTGSISNF